jgi:hypothetical protein
MIATNVSRVLKQSGFMIVSTRKREGILVTHSSVTGGATVFVQIDYEPKANKIADEAAEVLREKGYFVNRDGTLLFVEKQKAKTA